MLKVSQTKTSISPVGRFWPIKMPVNAAKPWAEELHDELYASVLVVKTDNTDLVWITLDAVGTSENYSKTLREKISEKRNVPFDNINIGYTHSHCAPRLGEGRDGQMDVSEEYLEYTQDKVVDAVNRAYGQKFADVEVYVKSFDGLGLYSNRNGLERLGDTELKMLEFRDCNNNVKAAALNFACHSTVINHNASRMISGDLAAYLSRGIEKRTGVYPVIMVGAAGDMSNRCVRQRNDFAEVVRLGEGLLSRMDMVTEWTKLDVSEVTVTPYQFKETYVTTKEQRQAQIANIKEKIANAPTDDLRRVFTTALNHASAEPNGTTYVMDCKGVIVKMGDITVCTMPAELFSKLGLQIKAAMNVKCPIFWGYSNYSVGYLYNKEEAGLSFESAATNIPVGVPEAIAEMLCSMVG